MSQHDYILDDAPGADFRADINSALAALLSRNAGASAPTAVAQGAVYVKTVSSTIQELYEYDGANWVLTSVINPTTHEFRSIDGRRREWGGNAGGSANALTITTSPAITAYEDGQTFVFYTGAGDNSGAMTLDVDSMGTKSIKINGADPGAGDVPANTLIVVRYRSTGNIMHVIGGALRRATTALYGNVLLDNEAGFLAGTAGKVPTSDVIKKHARERLAANRTYYVRTDGSDSNTGLVDSAGGAFLTLSKAWATIVDTLDLYQYIVTVQIGDGTYTGQLLASGRAVGQYGPGDIVFQGNAVTPSNVVISTTGADAVRARQGAMVTVKDLKVTTTTTGHGIACFDRASMVRYSNINFGVVPAAYSQVFAERGWIECTGNYAISAGGGRHWWAASQGGIECRTKTLTITGTPAFSSAFLVCDTISNTLADGNTFSGSATGKRHDVTRNSVAATGGATLPGDVAGTTATGGLYS